MPTQPPANLTPPLRCPRCKALFRFPADQLGRLAMCVSCKGHFCVTQDRAGQYVVRAGSAPVAPPPHGAPPTLTPPHSAPTNLAADRTVMGIPTAAPPPLTTPRGGLAFDRTLVGKPGSPPPVLNTPTGAAEFERTVMGTPTAAPPPLTTPKGGLVLDRPVVSKPGGSPPPRHPPTAGVDCDRTVMGSPTAPPAALHVPLNEGLEADRTVMGKLTAPPAPADRGASPPAQPDAGWKPKLRCPQCTKPFRIPRERVGKLTKCSGCNAVFRVVEYTDGTYGVREEGVIVRQNPAGSPPPGNHALPDQASAHRSPANTPPSGAAASTAAGARGRGKRKLWLGLVLVLVGLGSLSAAGYFFLFRKQAVSLGRYGGIEIGSTGVKMIGLEYYDTPEGGRYRILAEPKDVNPDLTKPPKGQKELKDFAPGTLKRTVTYVRDYFEELRDKLGVPPENIYIVCSSGVLSPFGNNEAARTRNRDRLSSAIQEKTGKKPEFIDADLEAKYAVQAIVPKRDWKKAVVIDIGGENIKGGGYDDNGTFQHFEVARGGVKSFAKVVARAKHKDELFVAAARRLVRKEISAPLKKELEVPEVAVLQKRTKVYYLGGISWALATYTRPEEFYSTGEGDHPTYRCKISADDFAAFEQMVTTKTPREIKDAVLKNLANQGKWVKEVEKNLKKIQERVFKKQKRLVGGAQILRAVADAFKEKDVLQQRKEIFGYRYGHVAWLVGYIGARSGQVK